MQFLLYISDFIIPLSVFIIVTYGCLQRVNLYETFLVGAKEGLTTVVNILPTLIGLLLAVEVFRAGGALELLTSAIRPLAGILHMPVELIPLSIIRLISSSAATGLLLDIFAQFGPDSYVGRCASVMMSSTETVVYTMSLYFLSIGVRRTSYTLPCALLANLAGVVASVILVGCVFGN